MREEILVENNYLNTDLLLVVLCADAAFWTSNVDLWQRVNEIVLHLETLKEMIEKIVSTAEFFRTKPWQ